MLRLIRPGSGGQETHRPRKRRPGPTDAENARLKVVIKNLHRAYGTWGCLAQVMGVTKNLLHSIVAGRERGSYTIAVLAARAACLPVEEVLTSGLTLARHCPLCGAQHRGAAQAQAQGQVAT